jgi:transposase InsO family protein
MNEQRRAEATMGGPGGGPRRDSVAQCLLGPLCLRVQISSTGTCNWLGPKIRTAISTKMPSSSPPTYSSFLGASLRRQQARLCARQPSQQTRVPIVGQLEMGAGGLFLAVVLDLFSRRVVGLGVRDRGADDCGLATWPAEGADAPFGSGQPVHERSVPTRPGRARHHVQHEPQRQCLGQLGDRELLLQLKTERVCRRQYLTREEARFDVFDYIERFYNPRRRHSKLQYLSPVAF